jgi:hypothetical protein
MENPQPVGSGDLRYLVWNVYTATLFAPSGAWAPDAPFALHIVYHMDIEGEESRPGASRKCAGRA